MLSASFTLSLFTSWLSEALSSASSFDVFTIETRLAFFLSPLRCVSIELVSSLMQNLSIHFRSDAGVDGADTVQNTELLDEKIGTGALIGGNFKSEQSGALSNKFASIVLKLVGGVIGEDGMGDGRGEGRF